MSWLNTIFSKLYELFNWWYTVVPWQRAVRVRLGKHTKIMEPGIHVQIPFIDKVFVQNIRTRVTSTTAQALTTNDGVTITVCAGIRLEIVDVLKLYDKVHQPSDTICQEVEGHFSEYIITHSAKDCTPNKVLAYVKSKTDLTKYGINVSNIFLTDFVKTKTYRLIQGGLDRYQDAGINVNSERRKNARRVLG